VERVRELVFSFFGFFFGGGEMNSIGSERERRERGRWR
jgi:hypothetical protein